MYKLSMHKFLKSKNGNSNAKFKRTYEIKRNFLTKNDPTKLKQISKNLKLLKRILRKRKIFFRLFIYFLELIFYLMN